MSEKDTTIPMSECEHGYVYRIAARNFRFGVYRATDKSFIGLREKFFDQYLFAEYHWDTGAPFGTVKPLEKLMFYKNDLSEDDDELFRLLEILETKHHEQMKIQAEKERNENLQRESNNS